MPLPMRIALVAGAAVVLYLGVFPSSALELARTSVEGMMSAGGAVLGVGQ